MNVAVAVPGLVAQAPPLYEVGTVAPEIVRFPHARLPAIEAVPFALYVQVPGQSIVPSIQVFTASPLSAITSSSGGIWWMQPAP